MSALFPEIEPYQTHKLAVDIPHELYVEECGNPAGIPVVFIHGGPGAGCEKYHRQFFNPDVYRIILFDQRGSGRSTPHAELLDNTTQALVADLEAIRIYLGVDRWVVFGGSWGSTLGLVYAQSFPENILGLIVRGIFLCRPHEIEWFYQSGADKIYPDYWQDYIGVIPEDERGNLVAAFYDRLTSEDESVRLQAAKAWSVWEGRTATLLGRGDVVDFFSQPHVALSLARIECHYFMHNAFLQDNQILNNAHKLAKIPGVIVQGRYDMICPMESAWQLHQAWPQAEFQIISDAGHAASEPGISRALVAATEVMAEKVA